MASARRIDDGRQGWDESLELTDEGARGHRHYRVDTRRLDAMVTADGLPRVGDRWSDDLPLLAVRSIAPVWRAGVESEGNGNGVVRVDYATPSLGSGESEPDGSAFTRMGTSVVVATVFEGVLEDGTPSGQAIEGGAPREAGMLTARVVATFPAAEIDARIAGWVSLVGSLNDAPVALPRVARTQRSVTLAAGQLLYQGFDEPELIAGGGAGTDRVRVTQRLRVAEDFIFRKAVVDDRGVVVRTDEATLYPRRAFVGLW